MITTRDRFSFRDILDYILGISILLGLFGFVFYVLLHTLLSYCKSILCFFSTSLILMFALVFFLYHVKLFFQERQEFAFFKKYFFYDDKVEWKALLGKKEEMYYKDVIYIDFFDSARGLRIYYKHNGVKKELNIIPKDYLQLKDFLLAIVERFNLHILTLEEREKMYREALKKYEATWGLIRTLRKLK